MWNRILTLSSDKGEVIATMPKDIPIDTKLNKNDVDDALNKIGAINFYIEEDQIDIFIKLANEGKKEAFHGISIAKRLNAEIDCQLENDKMLANLVVKGAYGGRGLRGSEIINALAQGHILKGINKLALKKVLVESRILAPGEILVQPVAQGTPAIHGEDARCEPLVEDIKSRILAPQQKKDSEKLDMKDLGNTVSVSEGDAVMRKINATHGKSGFTVTGEILEPVSGKDIELKPGKNTIISEEKPDQLIATISGLPIIKGNSVDIENAMVLKNVGIETGHIKFKGNLVITGNIESGMVVRATGDITVGGFIESADVQAQGDITIAKGIIGHTISDDQEPSCIIKSGRSITASYAQYSSLQARDDINLKVHSISNQIMCGRNLTVLDDNEKGGTLSGRFAKVGEKITCYNLGVEGDTATYVQAFAKYESMKKKYVVLKDEYDLLQNKMMDIVRKEIEFKKKKAAERSDEEGELILQEKENCNLKMTEAKDNLNLFENGLNGKLLANVVDVKNHLHTHVTVQFGNEKILTKKNHGPTVLSFNQHEIKVKSKLENDDIQ